jgi:signal transduction histidine kinase
MKPFFWWFIAILLCIDWPLTIIFKDQYSVANEILHSFFTLICLFLAITGLKNKKPADWLIGLIALAAFFINLSSLLLFFANVQLGSGAIAGISPFIITISAVIYLALRYGRVNTSLEQQLKQVQILSELNLKTEKEKQEILASQNETLEQQVTQRTAELKTSLSELKSTQSQLIQSEKMASLGELTAGIAHEIQNPLNFINNFSEVNKELIEELEQEAIKGNILEVKALASDLRNNEQKINHHGKRADAIVKGMLQHSRTNTGQKEPTDINALADEYLRLSYHGCRARDKFFNTSFETHFDDTLEKIAVVPQEIGRVFLNIFNNAFYACTERSRSEADEKQKQNIQGYEPTVTLKTSRNPPSGGRGAGVIITISDNGTGIPQKALDKIFQPFFTTKPTGQGTGLGLSLSYDIIKAHGGELKVETNEGEGTQFTIILRES